MVGDIIQDPLGGLVKGAVVAGSWAIGSAINAYKQNYDFVTEYGRDFLNGKFTTDDLVDVPPPPAEDLGTVVPDAPPSAGGQSSGSSGKTFEELATELVQNEAKYGIQSPLGPEDPNFVSVPVNQEKRNKDPQAPLKPAFTPSPEPAVRQTPGANLVMNRAGSYMSQFNPGGDSDYTTYPVFRGSRGGSRALTWISANFFAVPIVDGNQVKWKARVQVLDGSRVASTWEFDAGTRPPISSDFDLRFASGKLGFDDSVLTDLLPQFGERVSTYPLQVSAAPPLIPDSSANQLISNTGKDPLLASFSPSQPAWTSSLMDPPAESDNLPGEGLLPKVPLRNFPSTPVVPSTTVPVNPNNPLANPAIGTNGLPLQNIAQIVQTGTDVHKIGDLAVNSGKIRATTASIAKEVGRIEQKTANIANKQGDLLTNLGDLADIVGLLAFLKELLEAPLDPKTLTLSPVCEEDAEPTQVQLPSEKYTDRIQSTLDAIPVLLQAHLGYKTPICGNEKPKLLGRWVTTRWLSDGDSPNGGRRLRKLFRYRTQSSRTNPELSEFWDGFTWQAGPTLVQHKGAWWGTPACWAIDETEGKRVIRNAGREAGLDPDLDGEWIVGGSRSTRYGMEGTMRLAKLGRWNHTVSRDGSDGYPSADSFEL